jgi:hypothetical protein
MCASREVRCGRNLLPPRIAKSGVELTLKTLGTVTVSLVDSPLAEMTVTVGLDMVSRVGVAVVSIADLGVVVAVAIWTQGVGASRKLLAHGQSKATSRARLLTQHLPVYVSTTFASICNITRYSVVYIVITLRALCH